MVDGICIVQFVHDVLTGSGPFPFVIPSEVTLDESALNQIAYQYLIQFIQTTFIENAVEFVSGRSRNEPYDRISYTFIEAGHTNNFQNRRACVARFARQAVRYFHPLGMYHRKRGIEVLNPDDLFEGTPDPLPSHMDQQPNNTHKTALKVLKVLFTPCESLHKQQGGAELISR